MYMYVCVPCEFLVHVGPEEGIKSAGTGATDRCEPPCRCWELNTRTLEE